MKVMKCANCLKIVHPKDGDQLKFCPFCGESMDKASVYEENVDVIEEVQEDGSTRTTTVQTTKSKTAGSYTYNKTTTTSRSTSTRTDSAGSQMGHAESQPHTEGTGNQMGHTGTRSTGSQRGNYHPTAQRPAKIKKQGIVHNVIFGLIYGLVVLGAVTTGYSLSATIAIIQTILMIASILQKKGVINFPFKRFSLFCMIFSLVLFFPFLAAISEDSTRIYLAERQMTEIDYPRGGFTDMLPAPISDYGRIYTNNELEFNFDFYNVSQPRYEAYVKSLKRMGYSNVDYEFSTSFCAFNEEGYKVTAYLSSDGSMDIRLESPQQLEYFDWPDSRLAQMLPEPEYPYGRIDSDRSEAFSMCLGRMSESDFQDYVRDCRELGFTNDYERTKHSYTAYDESGSILLFLEWDEPNRTMNVHIMDAAAYEEDADPEENLTQGEEEDVVGTAEEINEALQDNGMLAFESQNAEDGFYYLIDAEMKTVTKIDTKEGLVCYGSWEEGDLDEGITVTYTGSDMSSFKETISYKGASHDTLQVIDKDHNKILLENSEVETVLEQRDQQIQETYEGHDVDELEGHHVKTEH